MNKTNDNETNPSEILKDLIVQATRLRPEFVKENQRITRKVTEDIINLVANYYAVPKHVALTGIFIILQRGGTSRNKKSNVRIRFGETTFESKIINQNITKLAQNFTPRQFARYFADQIYELSKVHDINGNCYIYLTRNLPDYLTGNPDEKYWASDFQVENPNCPENIRKALNIRYNEKFRGRIRKNTEN